MTLFYFNKSLYYKTDKKNYVLVSYFIKNEIITLQNKVEAFLQILTNISFAELQLLTGIFIWFWIVIINLKLDSYLTRKNLGTF